MTEPVWHLHIPGARDSSEYRSGWARDMVDLDAEQTRGRFGPYGGQFVPETLMPVLEELSCSYIEALHDPSFRAEFASLCEEYVGRPTPLYLARRLSAHLKGARVYLKREDLAHTGAHKINNALGQCLLARRMGRIRVVAETGAGQHGVATATACALLGLQCVIYMGEEDMDRQSPNVLRMRLLDAEVRCVTTGSRTLKDAISEAMRDWVANVGETYYLLGSVVGPHPFPSMVRTFQSIIGMEARQQILNAEGRLPDYVVACVGGGSNAMGIFHPFIDDTTVNLVGVEAAGRGLATGDHAASLSAGEVGVLHGARTYLLQDREGQVLPTHSISAGLDYPGVGPEISYYRDTGRVACASATDREALAAFHLLCRTEGIMAALESAHAVAHVASLAPELSPNQLVIVNISGRGDKDMYTVARAQDSDYE